MDNRINIDTAVFALEAATIANAAGDTLIALLPTSLDRVELISCHFRLTCGAGAGDRYPRIFTTQSARSWGSVISPQAAIALSIMNFDCSQGITTQSLLAASFVQIALPQNNILTATSAVNLLIDGGQAADTVDQIWVRYKMWKQRLT